MSAPMEQPPPPADAQPPAIPPPVDQQPPPAGTRPRRRSGAGRVLLMIGAIGFIAACAIAILGIVGWNIGIDGLVVGLIAAIVPVPVIVLAFLWLGRYEPEPPKYLIFCFTWGAFVSTLFALGVNTGAGALFERWEWPFSLVPVVVAPVSEELSKFAGPLLLWLVRRRAVSGLTKGIIYCGLSATGFAMVENILYLGGLGYRAGMDEFGPASGLMGLFAIFIVRILLFGFAHPLFTAASGIALGIAARTTSTAVRWLAPIAGVLIAMILHGTWNGTSVLVQETGQALFMLYGYVSLMTTLFLALVGLAIWLRAREGQLTQRTLPMYVRAGWLSPPEVASLSSLSSRHSARRWARRVAAEPGVRAMRAFQLAATRLAVLRDRVQRAEQITPADAAEEQRLLAEISAARAAYVGRDPQAPPAHWDGERYLVAFPDGSWRQVPPPAEPAVPVPVALAAPQWYPAPYPAPQPQPQPYPAPQPHPYPQYPHPQR